MNDSSGDSAGMEQQISRISDALGQSEYYTRSVYVCDNPECALPFVPERSRYLCPRCGMKNSCCEGEPQ